MRKKRGAPLSYHASTTSSGQGATMPRHVLSSVWFMTSRTFRHAGESTTFSDSQFCISFFSTYLRPRVVTLARAGRCARLGNGGQPTTLLTGRDKSRTLVVWKVEINCLIAPTSTMVMIEVLIDSLEDSGIQREP